MTTSEAEFLRKSSAIDSEANQESVDAVDTSDAATHAALKRMIAVMAGGNTEDATDDDSDEQNADMDEDVSEDSEDAEGVNSDEEDSETDESQEDSSDDESH